jgi:isocitrate lyase
MTHDDDTGDAVVISRIDTCGSANADWEEHVELGRMFADAGVDLVWPEMPDPSRQDAVRYAEALHETHPEAEGRMARSKGFTEEQADPISTNDDD